MKLIKQLIRPAKIIYIIIKFNLLSLILNDNNIIIKMFSKFFKKTFKLQKEKRIRIALEELGPIFVKLGQILSTRVDIIEKNTITELKKLQTNIKPINFKKIKIIIERSLNNKIENIFKNINENPLTSASIAQIHTGKLQNNDKIAIKILKPNIKHLIEIDIKILKIIAKILNTFIKNTKRLKPVAIINELDITLQNEINLKYEAANLTKIKKNFNQDKNIYIPKIYWNFLTENILVMEYLDGITITNKQKLKLQGFNTKNISENLINLFYIQAFKHNFFHADLHPGNILISKNNINLPVIILIDFGIISNLDKKETFYLAENILAFTKKDYKKIATLHLNAKTISTNKPLNEIENEICCVFEPILNKKIKDISFKNAITSILMLSKNFEMQIQPQLILFQKTLLTIESLCRQISPEINIWNSTRLSIEKNLLKDIFLNKTQNNIKSLIKSAKLSTINEEDIQKNTYQKIKKNILEKILSKKLLTFTVGYIIGLSMLISFLKYNQALIFLL